MQQGRKEIKKKKPLQKERSRLKQKDAVFSSFSFVKSEKKEKRKKEKGKYRENGREAMLGWDRGSGQVGLDSELCDEGVGARLRPHHRG